MSKIIAETRVTGFLADEIAAGKYQASLRNGTRTLTFQVNPNDAVVKGLFRFDRKPADIVGLYIELGLPDFEGTAQIVAFDRVERPGQDDVITLSVKHPHWRP